jgi:hypothetical protein
MDFTLSRYIARLQHLLDRHGDIPVCATVGEDGFAADKPIVRRAKRKDGYYVISNEGEVAICVIQKDPEAGSPYYRSMSRTFDY